MLHPKYFARVTKSNGGWDYDSRELPEGCTHTIIKYSQYKDFCLVTYERKVGENSMVGETLYHHSLPITSGGGKIPIYEPKLPVPKGASRTFRYWQSSVKDRLNHGSGRFVPDAIAKKLRDSLSIRSIPQ
ncbi:hypothetical protein V6O07_21460 [Arthrospira platensis SPKY2]